MQRITEAKSGGSPLRRYLAFQVPSWIVAALLVVAARHWPGVPYWAGGAVLAAWIAKDLLLYPLVKDGYAKPSGRAADRIVGISGTAVDRLDPDGRVRLGAELWRGEIAPGALPVEPGERVRVVGVDGLCVIVERASSEQPL